MADQEQSTQTNQEGISEDELRGMISSALDDKLEERGLSKDTLDRLSKLDILDSIGDLFKENKTEPLDRDSLLGDIGKMIDDKIKGISSGGSGGGNGNSERKPRISIFS